MKWYDIHTCPRNGTKILCYSPGNKDAKITRARKASVTVDAISPRYPYFKYQYHEAPYTLWTPIVMPHEEDNGIALVSKSQSSNDVRKIVNGLELRSKNY